jgi:tetratricopeptide (TPR) repeat protein
MLRYLLVCFVLLSGASVASAAPADEVADALSRAEALYYEAKFKDAIDVLRRVDDLLRPQTGRVPEKISVKLQLALANVGLNDILQAKAALRDVYALDADYHMDEQQVPPKVLVLAEEAKAEQSQVRCQAAREEARNYFQKWDAVALVNLIQTMKPKCAGLEAIEPDAAELLYKTGVDSYKAGQFPDALNKFRMAVKLSPKHELALQYLDLTQSKVAVNADRQLLDFRKMLEARQFQEAAALYVGLRKSADSGSPQTIEQMRVEYRRTLLGVVDAWNRACASADTTTLDKIRGQLPETIADPLLADDILAQMKTCTKKGCLQMGTQLVLARLKVQVNPVIPIAAQDAARRGPVTVHVKARIDEKGDVTASEAGGGTPMLNEAVRTAIERWKFAPIVDQSGVRCVDTDIPVTIKPQ